MNTSDKTIPNKIKALVDKNEYPLIVILAAALILKGFGVKHIDEVTILVNSTIALLYFCSAFGESKVSDELKSSIPEKHLFLIPFSQKLTGTSSAIICTGILFTTMRYPGAETQSIAGIGSLTGSLATLLYLRKVNEELVPKSLLIRCVSLLIITAYAWYFAN